MPHSITIIICQYHHALILRETYLSELFAGITDSSGTLYKQVLMYFVCIDLKDMQCMAVVLSVAL